MIFVYLWLRERYQQKQRATHDDGGRPTDAMIDEAVALAGGDVQKAATLLSAATGIGRSWCVAEIESRLKVNSG